MKKVFLIGLIAFAYPESLFNLSYISSYNSFSEYKSDAKGIKAGYALIFPDEFVRVDLDFGTGNVSDTIVGPNYFHIANFSVKRLFLSGPSSFNEVNVRIGGSGINGIASSSVGINSEFLYGYDFVSDITVFKPFLSGSFGIYDKRYTRNFVRGGVDINFQGDILALYTSLSYVGTFQDISREAYIDSEGSMIKINGNAQGTDLRLFLSFIALSSVDLSIGARAFYDITHKDLTISPRATLVLRF